jgi:hypothetical protein
MAKAEMAPTGQSDEYSFGDALLEGLQDVRDWKAGKLALEVVHIPAMPVAEVKRSARGWPRAPRLLRPDSTSRPRR